MIAKIALALAAAAQTSLVIYNLLVEPAFAVLTAPPAIVLTWAAVSIWMETA